MAADGPDSDQTRSFIALAAGTRVSRYTIVSKIGAGGMGEVYLAEDTELDRKVALKFLPSHLCQDEDCRKRFKREAQAAARLSHPNIIHVYEVSEHQGRPFFAMEHVEGRSLCERASGKDPSVDEILELGIQICEGLNEAHEKGITHRDIKPSNILIDSHGRAKIVDFGLASVAEQDHLTKTGSTMGTVGYMSPEQVQGKEIDSRSDLFSLGVILYELITKQNPFRRDSEAATLKAVSDDLPEPLARFKAGLPAGLQAIIDKALEKDVKIRYQHADEMRSDLMRVKRSVESGQSVVSTSLRSKHPARVWWVAAAVLFVIAVIVIITRPWQTDPATREPEKIMLAVLPFENLGDPEDEYFADGMTEEIIGRLTRLTGLGVISRTSSMRYKGTNKSIHQIGEELGVHYILEGSVRWMHGENDSRVRVQPQLISVATDTHVWSDSFDAIFRDILQVQSEIAVSVAQALDVTIMASERDDFDRTLEIKPAVYDLYLKSANYKTYDYATNQAAIDSLRKALSIDPAFAPAHARLAAAMIVQFQWFGESGTNIVSEARVHAERAIELDSTSADGYAALAEYYYVVDDDLGQAMYYLQLASSKEPENAHVLALMGEIMFMEGKFEVSRQFFERALSFDPARPQRWLATLLSWNREWQQLIAYYDKLIGFFPDSLAYKVFRAEAIGNKYLSMDSIRANLPPDLDTSMSACSNMRFWDALIFAGLYEKAKEGARTRLRTCELAVDSAETYLFLSIVCYFTEDNHYSLLADTVIAMFNHFLETESLSALRYDVVRAQLAMTYAMIGDTVAAGNMCDEVLAKAPVEDWSSISTILNVCAYAFAHIGQSDRAIDILEELMSRPSNVSLLQLLYDQGLDPLRDNPRFQALIKKYEKEHAI